jgi:hypothetical protein
MFATDHCAAAAREPDAFIPVGMNDLTFFPELKQNDVQAMRAAVRC